MSILSLWNTNANTSIRTWYSSSCVLLGDARCVKCGKEVLGRIEQRSCPQVSTLKEEYWWLAGWKMGTRPSLDLTFCQLQQQRKWRFFRVRTNLSVILFDAGWRGAVMTPIARSLQLQLYIFSRERLEPSLRPEEFTLEQRISSESASWSLKWPLEWWRP